MADLIGGTLMLILGGSMSATSISMARATPRSPIDRARDMLGDGAAPAPGETPADMLALLDQLH
jgi:hypothetical protein